MNSQTIALLTDLSQFSVGGTVADLRNRIERLGQRAADILDDPAESLPAFDARRFVFIVADGFSQSVAGVLVGTPAEARTKVDGIHDTIAVSADPGSFSVRACEVFSIETVTEQVWGTR